MRLINFDVAKTYPGGKRHEESRKSQSRAGGCEGLVCFRRTIFYFFEVFIVVWRCFHFFRIRMLQFVSFAKRAIFSGYPIIIIYIETQKWRSGRKNVSFRTTSLKKRTIQDHLDQK